MVDFQLDWSGLITAAILTGRFAAEWYIRIWIWCENQTLWLKCHSLSLTFYTAITFRDDVVPYYGACRSISKTLTICRQWSRWLTFIAVIGWCQVSSVRDDLGHQLYCDWNNWFGSRISLFGVSALRGCLVIPTIYSALVLLETCNVQQNFCSPLRFVKLELFWPSEMLVEIELHAWRSFVEVLWTKTTLYRTVVIIYFVLECKELWLFKFGWEPRVFENFWK